MKVTVAYTSTGDVFVAAIDQAPLTFTGGAAKRVVKSGDHALQWFIKGGPGSTYTIEISSPDEVKFKHEATLDASSKDAGLHWFKVNP